MEIPMIELSARRINYTVRTRAQRRVALASIIGQLKRIRDAEMDSLINVPSNLSFTWNYHVGETAIHTIDMVIDSLDRVYGNEKSVTKGQNPRYIPF
jgi:hypothetical protein